MCVLIHKKISVNFLLNIQELQFGYWRCELNSFWHRNQYNVGFSLEKNSLFSSDGRLVDRQRSFIEQNIFQSQINLNGLITMTVWNIFRRRFRCIYTPIRLNALWGITVSILTSEFSHSKSFSLKLWFFLNTNRSCLSYKNSHMTNVAYQWIVFQFYISNCFQLLHLGLAEAIQTISR